MTSTYGPPKSGGGLSTTLSILAVLLAAAALVGIFVIPVHAGPSGAAGAQGSTGSTGAAGTNGAQGPAGTPGPAGPGAHIYQVKTLRSQLMSNTTCRSYVGAEVNVTAAGPGVVMLSAEVIVEFIHPGPNASIFDVFLGNSSTDCSGPYALTAFPSGGSSGTYELTVSLVRTVSIPTAGTYSYFVTGYSFGAGIAQSYFEAPSVLQAAFFPS